MDRDTFQAKRLVEAAGGVEYVADNGGDWRMSVAPDKRLKGLRDLTRLRGSDFEVVDTEGARVQKR